jgi:FKBP-type peptidyl-prolyl cis-trans isomerase
MRFILFPAIATLLFLGSCSSDSSKTDENTAKESAPPKTQNEKLSYSLGIIASSSVMTKLEQSKILQFIIPEKMVQGITDFMDGKEMEVDPDKAKENLAKFFRALQENGPVKEMQEKDREILSYSIGVDAIREITGQITETGMDSVIRFDITVNAMSDYILGNKLHINVEDAKKLFSGYFQEANKKQQAKLLQQYEGNKQAGIEFLENNKKRPGIKVTQSGLQLETIREGKGKQPKLGDMVEVHYTGTFIDGKKFDSSHDRNESFSFGVDYNYPVISGWIEGAQLMKQGGKYKIYLPYELAYKESLDSPIPPYSALIFEIEVLSVKEGEAMPMYEK